jgi:hypothetical protein
MALRLQHAGKYFHHLVAILEFTIAKETSSDSRHTMPTSFWKASV